MYTHIDVNEPGNPPSIKKGEPWQFSKYYTQPSHGLKYEWPRNLKPCVSRVLNVDFLEWEMKRLKQISAKSWIAFFSILCSLRGGPVLPRHLGLPGLLAPHQGRGDGRQILPELSQQVWFCR